ncbi:PilZ domain-containing protein [Marinobacterium jannaschii]|uniref:hypothetical protein n=1 Tax=Marinobacterium jannaschii TaxID=64970 RepID=UPI0004844A35|nr:hypothetical protein [Marinobacterium jannaschii]
MFTLPEENNANANRRSAFRVDIDDSLPVRLKVAGIKVDITNLSATGIAFKPPSTLEEGTYDARISFKIDRVYVFELQLQVITTINAVARAEFRGLAEREQLLMSRLVLHLQKMVIRKEVEARRSEPVLRK